MERHVDQEINELKQRLLSMGGLCEKMIHLSIKALVDRDVKYLDEVYAHEREVNQLHLEIDDRCVKLFALHTPVAGDLRTIMGGMKINSELERIGDQSVNIAQNTVELLKQPQLKPLLDIPRMAQISMGMLRDSLDAFVKGDTVLAQAVVERDDQVDSLKGQVFRELITFMISDPTSIQRALDLILISRNLERLADHATNVAEDVIFMVKGKDIRHHADEPGYQPKENKGGLH
jgi:phosphate transport system protein